MPNTYKRISLERGKWSEDQLKNAMAAVKNDGISVRRAAEEFCVPRKTLERRLKTNDDRKRKLGPDSVFGIANENRLVKHIKEMQKSGFPLSREDLRRIAYKFAVQLDVKHKFNSDSEKAGYVWLQAFISRHPDISIRKAEGLSLARCNAMSRQVVTEYFKLLQNILEENGLLGNPKNIYNMDESGLQLNSKPGEVLATKGSKAVSSVTSTEKGETITIVACCNAEGLFLPPVAIMKGKNAKKELSDNMPPGSQLFMSQRSAYMNSDLFLKWLKTHFVPRKPEGKTLILLDGHTSHSSSVEMLEYAKENNIILFCFPSHCTHYLQPLDRSFFKSLKSYFYKQCQLWLKQHSGRRITRYQFGELLSKSWGRAATLDNGLAGFRATGIFPLNPEAIPDYAFSINETPDKDREELEPRENLPHELVEEPQVESAQTVNVENTSSTETPTKTLHDLSPVPRLQIETSKKRARSIANVLTSMENLKTKKGEEKKKKGQNANQKKQNDPSTSYDKPGINRAKGENKQKKGQSAEEKKQNNPSTSYDKPGNNRANTNTRVKKRLKRKLTDENSSDTTVSSYSSEHSSGKDDDICIVCGEFGKNNELWFRCTSCGLWLHKLCSGADSPHNFVCGFCMTRK